MNQSEKIIPSTISHFFKLLHIFSPGQSLSKLQVVDPKTFYSLYQEIELSKKELFSIATIYILIFIYLLHIFHLYYIPCHLCNHYHDGSLKAYKKVLYEHALNTLKISDKAVKS